MTGITHEPRLARLLRLRDQLDTEIAAERDIEKDRARRATELRNALEARRREERRDSISAATVRQWAATYGHPYPERGRVSIELIDLYLDANPHAARRTS